MLIEFSVTNYRSIKDRITLSMEASATKGKDTQSQGFPTGYKRIPHVMTQAALYGANGSGKSNILRAMDVLQDMVHKSHNMVHDDMFDEIGVAITPYRLSHTTKSSPSTFEIKFLHENQLFEYGFTANSQIVHQEWLYVTSNIDGSRRRVLLQRDSSDTSTAKVNVAGNKKLLRDATLPNQLMLSVAATTFKNEDISVPFKWIRTHLRIDWMSMSFTASQVYKGKKEIIMQLMQGLDMSFSDVRVQKEEFSPKDLPDDMPEAVRKEVINKLQGKEYYKPQTLHLTEEGDEEWFELQEESQGTKALFAFAAPMISVLKNGYTLIVDEIDASLHPLMLEGILHLFQSPVTNPKGAQLVFAIHNTHFMDMLPRDALWFTEKTGVGATTLVPLSDYERKDSPVEKRYLAGRYGAVPYLNEARMAESLFVNNSDEASAS